MVRTWIIRGLALTLLTLCVTAWQGSFLIPTMFQRYTTTLDGVVLDEGKFVFLHENPGMSAYSGWYLGQVNFFEFVNNWDFNHERSRHGAFGLSFFREPGVWFIQIPLWFPTLLSALLLWLLWRKTRPKYNGKGFPMEPAGKEATKP